MSVSIVPCFDRFPLEGSLIGKLLTGYGELEVELAICLGTVLGNINTAMRVMYRVGGEESRIQIADALMRQKFEQLNLIHPYTETIADMSFCRQIRNQFSHCQWWDDPQNKLMFVNIEQMARTPASNIMKRHKIDSNLLSEHEQYFKYTQGCLWYLNYELEKAEGKPNILAHTLPKKSIATASSQWRAVT